MVEWRKVCLGRHFVSDITTRQKQLKQVAVSFNKSEDLSLFKYAGSVKVCRNCMHLFVFCAVLGLVKLVCNISASQHSGCPLDECAALVVCLNALVLFSCCVIGGLSCRMH